MNIQSDALHEVMTVLQKHGVPLQHGTALLCRMKGMTLAELSTTCGYHRNSIYKALSGENQVQPDMEAAVTKEIGINPWLYAIEKNTKEVNCSN